MLTQSRLLVIGLAVFFGSRLVVEVVRITGATQSDPSLAASYLLNTISIFAAITVLVVFFRWLGDVQTVRRDRAMSTLLDPDATVLTAGKDPAVVQGLKRVLPDAPVEFWKVGVHGFLFTVVTDRAGIQFWFGGSEPIMAGSVPWSSVKSVESGSGVRMGRTHPTVVIEIETSGGLAVLPLIVSEPAPRTLMPVRKERAEAVVAALRRHVQSV